jgi:hypothetical protein
VPRQAGSIKAVIMEDEITGGYQKAWEKSRMKNR